MADTALKTGDPAPDFTLPTDTGESLRLSDLRGKRVVLYFYPADDTPGCTAQACGLRDAYPQIEEQNGLVLGVSPDNAESHRKFKTKYNLPFTLLVDADHKVAQTYGAWGEQTYAGRTSTGLIRSHYIIDEQGRIADAEIGVRAKDTAPQALAHLAR